MHREGVCWKEWTRLFLNGLDTWKALMTEDLPKVNIKKGGGYHERE